MLHDEHGIRSSRCGPITPINFNVMAQAAAIPNISGTLHHFRPSSLGGGGPFITFPSPCRCDDRVTVLVSLQLLGSRVPEALTLAHCSGRAPNEEGMSKVIPCL